MFKFLAYIMVLFLGYYHHAQGLEIPLELCNVGCGEKINIIYVILIACMMYYVICFVLLAWIMLMMYNLRFHC